LKDQKNNKQNRNRTWPIRHFLSQICVVSDERNSQLSNHLSPKNLTEQKNLLFGNISKNEFVKTYV